MGWGWKLEILPPGQHLPDPAWVPGLALGGKSRAVLRGRWVVAVEQTCVTNAVPSLKLRESDTHTPAAPAPHPSGDSAPVATEASTDHKDALPDSQDLLKLTPQDRTVSHLWPQMPQETNPRLRGAGAALG